MATSEHEIRHGVKILLEKHGSLTTKEVKQLLHTVMPFDDDDKVMSSTRNEPLILQRIGNVVSHQKNKLQFYLNSYQIDKNQKPAVWSILRGLKSNNTLQKISPEEEAQKKQIERSFKPRQIDWDGINSYRTELGYEGECFAVRYETTRVLAFAPEDLDRITHLSKEQGDGAGFDILSLSDDGNTRYIEVKTTKGGLNAPFYMSENERQFFLHHQQSGDAFIYRVYNFDETAKKGCVEIISANELFSEYEFDPINYKVTKK